MLFLEELEVYFDEPVHTIKKIYKLMGILYITLFVRVSDLILKKIEQDTK